MQDELEENQGWHCDLVKDNGVGVLVEGTNKSLAPQRETCAHEVLEENDLGRAVVKKTTDPSWRLIKYLGIIWHPKAPTVVVRRQ